MSNSNSRKKSRAKDIAFGVIIFLLCGAMCAVAMGLMGVFDKDRNPDNLLKLDDYVKLDDRIDDTGYGVTFDWKEDGSFTVLGSNGAPDVEENHVSHYTFATLTLEAGTYTISGYKNSQLNTLGVYALVDGEEVYEGDNGTFTIDDVTEVVIGVYICNDKLFVNAKVCPTLVEGDTVGSFYTK